MLSFNEAYFAICQAIELSVQERLNRPLELEERLGIWNAGSLMMLESVERHLSNITDHDALSHELRTNAVMFRPKQEEYRQKLLKYASNQGKLDSYLKYQIDTAQTVYDLFHILETHAD